MNLADSLSGCAGLEGIQWLLLAPAPRRILRDQLKSLLSGRSMLGPCRLRRARFKPGRKLTAHYDALVRNERNTAYCVRPVAVTWGADDKPNRGPAEHAVAEMQAEARRHGVAAPFERLSADLAHWSMHISVSPLDSHFPQLVRLMDPRYVAEMLATVYSASAPASTPALADRYAVISIRYRPGQRHVLRYDRLDGAKTRVFAKLYRDEDGARTFRVATQAAEWLEQQAEGSTAVRPLVYVAEHGAVLYPALSGEPLTETFWRHACGLGRWLGRAGTALRALHLLSPSVAGPLPAHDFAAELGQTARASDFIRALLPSVGAAIDALFDRARELYQRLPQEPPTFTHGDFKSEHVWCGPYGLILLDFDSCHLGDPALDIGKFLAHLQLWHVLNEQPGLEPARQAFLAGYAVGKSKERLLRARLYEVVELVKITTRRVPLFDPDWTSRTERMIERAHSVMCRLELMMGVPAAQARPSVSGKEHAAHAR